MDIVLPFTIIKNEKQYDEYCKIIYDLMQLGKLTEAQEDVMDLLAILVEVYQDEHRDPYYNIPPDPVSSLKFVMEQNKMKAADLARELGVSKSLVSDILNYRRGFSKSFIRKLGKRFSFREESWNRPYKLKTKKASTVSKTSKVIKSSKTSKVSKPTKPTKAVKSALSSKSPKPTRRIKPGSKKQVA